MSLTLDRMRNLVRKGLGGLSTTDLPNEDCDELLNMSLWAIAPKFGFKELECLQSAVTVASQREYAIPTNLDAIVSLSLKDSDNMWHKLERFSVHKDDENYIEESDNEAQPTHFHRRNTALTLHPTPDDIYPLRMTMWKTVASLVEGSVITTGLPSNWDEIVVDGAIVRGHKYSQDYTLARQAHGLQASDIRGAVLPGAKEEKYDSRYARMRVIDSLPGDQT